MSQSASPAAASLIERLGFDAGQRVAVLHSDDIGMCHAANQGAFEALSRGPATCGSVMVPCPWFAEAAQRARENPDLDLGVHLTLNAEWLPYRWGPVAGAAAVPSLVDSRGHFFRSSAETVSSARPEEVGIELRAQIDRALDCGIDVTHIDSHMGTVFAPSLVGVYFDLAREYRLPAFLARPTKAEVAASAASGALDTILRLVDGLENEGFPVFDGFDANSLGFAKGTGLDHNLSRLRELGPGIHYLICHPALGGEELEALTPDAHCRDFERSFYGGPEGARALADLGIETLGMRPLRALLRE